MKPIENNNPQIIPSPEDIILWVKENFIGKYIIEITDDLEIIINGSCTLANAFIEELKYKFKEVNGSFNIGGHSTDNTGLCNSYKIKTLKNCPEIVRGNFGCQLCPNLKSLEYGPKTVTGNYKCSHCDLRNLDGIATEIGKYVIAYCNHKLTDINSLKDSKFIKADFEYCADELYNTDEYFDLCVNDKILYPIPD